MKEYFLLINYKTKERYLCSWFQNEPDFFGQKVYYIGATGGLGGYMSMIKNGFIDRRFSREINTVNKVLKYKIDKWQKWRDNLTRREANRLGMNVTPSNFNNT